MTARFVKPVIGGDDITTEMWATEPGEIVFRAINQDDDVIVDAGRLRHGSVT